MATNRFRYGAWRAAPPGSIPDLPGVNRDRAIELVQKLLSIPGYTNYARLKFHPLWSPLRGDPRFEKIVASLAPASPR